MHTVLRLEPRRLKEFILSLIEYGYLTEYSKWGKIHYKARMPENPNPWHIKFLTYRKKLGKDDSVEKIILNYLLNSSFGASIETISVYTELPVEEIRKAIVKLYSLDLIKKETVKGTSWYVIVDIEQYRILDPVYDQNARTDWKNNLFSKIIVSCEEPANAEAKQKEPEMMVKVEPIGEPRIKKKKQYKKRESGLSITSEIIFHLERLAKEHYDGSVNKAHTQEGIRAALRIDQRYITSYLKRLKDKNYVKMTKMHVKGEKKQYKCYFLTFDGEREAKRLRELQMKT